MRCLDLIQVSGFKSIYQLDLALSPLNVLIGPNGAGKSNLVSVFEMLNQIVARNLQVYVGQTGSANALLFYGRQITERIEIDMAFGPNGYGCELVPTAQDNLIFGQEWCWFHGSDHTEPIRHILGRGHRETLLHEATGDASRRSIADSVLRAMRGWRVYHFHDTSATARIKASGEIHDNADLRDDASNLAAYLYLLQERHPECYARIVDTVRLVAPFFDDFSLQPSRLNPDKIRLEWRERGSDAYFNAHSLSDGTLRFICLATLLQMPDPPATILIDEPELGLHPYAIALLAGLLRKAARCTQVIVSTQSVTLVNQFAPEDVIVVDREEQGSVFSRPDAEVLNPTVTVPSYETSIALLCSQLCTGSRPRCPRNSMPPACVQRKAS